jgi:cyclic dehypoxanthinyl futalosine synthase
LLFEEADFLLLANAANYIRQKKHPEKTITFVIDRNINYTNVCLNKCSFCAFYKNAGDDESYVLSIDEVVDKVNEAVALDGTQIMLQGGLNPDIELGYYLDILSSLREKFGKKIQIHSFSPPEISFLAQNNNLSIKELLLKLNNAGLDSIPGGGAEMLVDKVRRKISPKKIMSKKWLGVMEEAHKIGMKTTSTMMFGSVESYEDRVSHLEAIRDLQDKYSGFTAFIPWTFQAGNTELGGKETDAIDYLKTLAISRLYLDNIDNIQASWVTQGSKIAQLSILFGANDMGSTMIEENVVKATGVDYRLSKSEIIGMIEDAGYSPAQRTTDYRIIRMFNGGTKS